MEECMEGKGEWVATGVSLGPRLALDLKANFCLGAIAFRACESLLESPLIRWPGVMSTLPQMSTKDVFEELGTSAHFRVSYGGR